MPEVGEDVAAGGAMPSNACHDRFALFGGIRGFAVAVVGVVGGNYVGRVALFGLGHAKSDVAIAHKTTTATSLAITMAASGNRVLLVDADMRRPRIHRIFGLENQAGLSSLILGEGTLGVPPALPGAGPRRAPLRPGPAQPGRAAPHRRLPAAAGRRWPRSYDRVIIDSPPIGVVADAVVIGTHVDGVLMVLKAGKTSRDVARQAVKQLRDRDQTAAIVWTQRNFAAWIGRNRFVTQIGITIRN